MLVNARMKFRHGGTFRGANRMGMNGMLTMPQIEAVHAMHNTTMFGDPRRDSDQVKRFLHGGNFEDTDPTDPKPKFKPTGDTFFNPGNAVGQTIQDDPNDESRFITQGEQFLNSNRIGSDGFTGTNRVITQSDIDNYRNIQQQSQDQLDNAEFDDEGNPIIGENPLSQFDNDSVFGNKDNRQELFRRFEGGNTNSATFTEGEFKAPEGVQSNIVNHRFSGFSSTNRNRELLPQEPLPPADLSSITSAELASESASTPTFIPDTSGDKQPISLNQNRAGNAPRGKSRRQKQLSKENKRRLRGRRAEGGRIKIASYGNGGKFIDIANQF